MKNTLLCTTAMAMTGIAGAASAVEISAGAITMDIGGFYTTVVAIGSVDTGATLAGSDFDGLDVFTNSEIIFVPSITLDNGIKFSANIQLEADSGAQSDTIDESYITISGDFGSVLIGSENSAGYKMGVGANDVSHIGLHSSSLSAFVPYNVNPDSPTPPVRASDVFRGTLGTTDIENFTNNDSMRITYFSPRFSGLQLGASYARSSKQAGAATDNNATTTDIIDIAANYSGSFGGVDVNASARYGTASAVAGGTDPEIWGAGLRLGFNGFTFGGAYAEQDGTALSDGRSFNVGVSYANGPMSYSLTYFDGENINNEAPGTKESLQTVMLAARYQVAPGLSVGAFIADTQFEEAATPADNVEGTVLGVSASFSF